MPGLRLLFRMAPFLAGAVAVGVWRRRRAERKALPAGPQVRELEAGQQAKRFQREPIDIVTVVDDLLLGGG